VDGIFRCNHSLQELQQGTPGWLACDTATESLDLNTTSGLVTHLLYREISFLKHLLFHIYYSMQFMCFGCPWKWNYFQEVLTGDCFVWTSCFYTFVLYPVTLWNSTTFFDFRSYHVSRGLWTLYSSGRQNMVLFLFVFLFLVNFINTSINVYNYSIGFLFDADNLYHWRNSHRCLAFIRNRHWFLLKIFF
jgi:hypothetical protein